MDIYKTEEHPEVELLLYSYVSDDILLQPITRFVGNIVSVTPGQLIHFMQLLLRLWIS